MGNPAMPFIIENRGLGALRPGPKLVPSNTLLRRVIYRFSESPYRQRFKMLPPIHPKFLL